MTNKHHVYMTGNGRISLAGLSAAKTPMLAAALVHSFKAWDGRITPLTFLRVFFWGSSVRAVGLFPRGC